MARFKTVDMRPRFLPMVREQPVVPRTLEHALHVLMDTEFELIFMARCTPRQRRSRCEREASHP